MNGVVATNPEPGPIGTIPGVETAVVPAMSVTAVVTVIPLGRLPIVRFA